MNRSLPGGQGRERLSERRHSECQGAEARVRGLSAIPWGGMASKGQSVGWRGSVGGGGGLSGTLWSLAFSHEVTEL